MSVQLLTSAERDRLLELIDVMNTATQIDREEAMEANRLWSKLTNDGDPSPVDRPVPERGSADRAINLNTEVVISEGDWTLNFCVEGRDAIETDVRRWARNLLSDGLSANGVHGFAH